jgi:hypothetical protein
MANRTYDARSNEKPSLAVDRGSLASAGTEVVRAWEEIETGRYMPRRTRGSFPGRELG